MVIGFLIYPNLKVGSEAMFIVLFLIQNSLIKFPWKESIVSTLTENEFEPFKQKMVHDFQSQAIKFFFNFSVESVVKVQREVTRTGSFLDLISNFRHQPCQEVLQKIAAYMVWKLIRVGYQQNEQAQIIVGSNLWKRYTFVCEKVWKTFEAIKSCNEGKSLSPDENPVSSLGPSSNVQHVNMRILDQMQICFFICPTILRC